MTLSTPSQFDPEKALEALVYVCGRIPGNDMYRSLKAMYIADKLHLQRYGRFIYGEHYARLPHGATPQNAYDAARVLNGEREASAIPVEFLREALTRLGNRIKPNRQPDIDVLSRSDVACLDEAIREVAFSPFNHAKELAHDSAWHATAHAADINLEAIIDALPEERRQPVREYLSR